MKKSGEEAAAAASTTTVAERQHDDNEEGRRIQICYNDNHVPVVVNVQQAGKDDGTTNTQKQQYHQWIRLHPLTAMAVWSRDPERAQWAEQFAQYRLSHQHNNSSKQQPPGNTPQQEQQRQHYCRPNVSANNVAFDLRELLSDPPMLSDSVEKVLSSLEDADNGNDDAVDRDKKQKKRQRRSSWHQDVDSTSDDDSNNALEVLIQSIMLVDDNAYGTVDEEGFWSELRSNFHDNNSSRQEQQQQQQRWLWDHFPTDRVVQAVVHYQPDNGLCHPVATTTVGGAVRFLTQLARKGCCAAMGRDILERLAPAVFTAVMQPPLRQGTSKTITTADTSSLMDCPTVSSTTTDNTEAKMMSVLAQTLLRDCQLADASQREWLVATITGDDNDNTEDDTDLYRELLACIGDLLSEEDDS